MINRVVISPGLSLLDPRMDTKEARAMLIAIGMQESRFQHRRQISGPARGFWQFEKAGIEGVLSHRASYDMARRVCAALRITPTVDSCYDAITYNDALAVCFARLLLWTLPEPLPGMKDVDEGWRQYIKAWRPGKPHRETWDAFFFGGWADA